MKVVPLYPSLDPMPLEMVHVGAVVGRTVCCRIPFGPLDRSQVDSISGVSVGLPGGFSLQPFDEMNQRILILSDGSVVLGIRAEVQMPAGEYNVKVSIETPGQTADIIPPNQMLNCLVVHLYPADFPTRNGRAKKSPAKCRARAADQN